MKDAETAEAELKKLKKGGSKDKGDSKEDSGAAAGSDASSPTASSSAKSVKQLGAWPVCGSVCSSCVALAELLCAALLRRG